MAFPEAFELFTLFPLSRKSTPENDPRIGSDFVLWTRFGCKNGHMTDP